MSLCGGHASISASLLIVLAGGCTDRAAMLSDSASGSDSVGTATVGATESAGTQGTDSVGTDSAGTDTSTMNVEAFEVTSFAVGVQHTCAVGADDHLLYCAGSNDSGQLGQPMLMGTSSVAVPVEGLTDVIGVTARWRVTCAWTADGDVYCFGNGSRGTVGDGGQGEGYLVSTPAKVALPGPAERVVTSGAVTCAVLAADTDHPFGSVWCWGANTSGQLGFDSPECGPYEFSRDTVTTYTQPCQATPRELVGAEAGSLSVAGDRVCAIDDAGQVRCLGKENPYGQLGDGTTVARDPAAWGDVVGGHVAQRLAVGAHHGCLLDADNALHCWGDGGYGALGNGANDNTPTPLPVNAAAWGNSGVTALAAGDNTTCAVAAGAAYCWGDVNYVFEVEPVPGNAATPLPVKIPNATDVDAIDTHGFHTCVRDSAGTLRCFGPSDDGQLGNGEMQKYTDWSMRPFVRAL